MIKPELKTKKLLPNNHETNEEEIKQIENVNSNDRD